MAQAQLEVVQKRRERDLQELNELQHQLQSTNSSTLELKNDEQRAQQESKLRLRVQKELEQQQVSIQSQLRRGKSAH